MELQTIAHTHQVFSRHEKRDLTGTVVRTNRPVTVMASVQCTYGPPETGTCDPITVVLPDIQQLGQTYILPPIAGRADTTGYFAQVRNYILLFSV